MNYSSTTKPAKILNLENLNDLNERLYLTRSSDISYFDTKSADVKKTAIPVDLSIGSTTKDW